MNPVPMNRAMNVKNGTNIRCIEKKMNADCRAFVLDYKIWLPQHITIKTILLDTEYQSFLEYFLLKLAQLPVYLNHSQRI